MNGRKTSKTPINITGKTTITVITPIEVRDVQIDILNNIIIPLAANKWAVVEENLFFVDVLKKKLENYIKIYNMPSLKMYIDILTIYNNVLNEHKHALDLESKVYTSTSENLINIIYKTSMIKLKPEYDLYNLILGAPNIASGEDYNPEIINDILKMVGYVNTSFQKIQQGILAKWR
jgi:hypothetical protein